MSNNLRKPPTDIISSENRYRVFGWSSPEKSGIARILSKYKTFIQDQLEKDPKDPFFLDRLAYTLDQKRTKFSWRFNLVASSTEDLLAAIEKSSKQPTQVSKISELVFIFTGQGAQWFAMGRELLTIPVFHESIKESGRILSMLGCEWDLMTELEKDDKTTRINEAALSQPACTALQIALLELLDTWNIAPRAVIGHSSGEIAAAYCKGAFGKETALKAAYLRGTLSQKIQTDGTMAAVGLGPEKANEYISQIESGKVTVACINSPSSVTLSGDRVAIEEVVEKIAADGIFARQLAVKTAYHSHHMSAIAEEYLQSIGPIEFLPEKKEKITMISSVTGRPVEISALGGEYWVSNLVNPVNFSGAVQQALASASPKVPSKSRFKFCSFLEIGPHAALQGPLKQILEQTPGRHQSIGYISVLRRKESAVVTSFKAAATLANLGLPVSISTINDVDSTPPKGRTLLVNAPSYAWNHSAVYWQESAATALYRTRAHPRTEFLGIRDVNSTAQEPNWKNYLRVNEQPWLEHHRFQGTNIYPMAGFMVMAIEGLRQMLDSSTIEGFEFRDLSIHQALVVPSDQSVETKLDIRPWKRGSVSRTTDWRDITVSSRAEDGTWTTNVTGFVRTRPAVKQDHTSAFYDENEHIEKNLKQKYDEINALPLDKHETDVFYSDVSSENFLSLA